MLDRSFFAARRFAETASHALSYSVKENSVQFMAAALSVSISLIILPPSVSPSSASPLPPFAQTQTPMATSEMCECAADIKTDAFSVSRFIHESEHQRYIKELNIGLLPLTDRSHRNSDFTPLTHTRLDSKSSFILYKERKRVPGLQPPPPPPLPSLPTEAKDLLTIRRRRVKRAETGKFSHFKLNFSEVCDPNVTPVDWSGSPRLKQSLESGRKDGNRDLSRGSLAASKRDLRSLCHKSALKSLISQCKATESSVKAERRAMEESKGSESKLLQKFLDTVKYLQDVDLYEARVLPKVYTEKVKQEEFVRSEAANVLHSFHVQKSDPWRPSVRCSLRRRKVRVEL